MLRHGRHRERQRCRHRRRKRRFCRQRRLLLLVLLHETTLLRPIARQPRASGPNAIPTIPKPAQKAVIRRFYTYISARCCTRRESPAKQAIRRAKTPPSARRRPEAVTNDAGNAAGRTNARKHESAATNSTPSPDGASTPPISECARRCTRARPPRTRPTRRTPHETQPRLPKRPLRRKTP